VGAGYPVYFRSDVRAIDDQGVPPCYGCRFESWKITAVITCIRDSLEVHGADDPLKSGAFVLLQGHAEFLHEFARFMAQSVSVDHFLDERGDPLSSTVTVWGAPPVDGNCEGFVFDVYTLDAVEFLVQHLGGFFNGCHPRSGFGYDLDAVVGEVFKAVGTIELYTWDGCSFGKEIGRPP
jgi:hypothetical protein